MTNSNQNMDLPKDEQIKSHFETSRSLTSFRKTVKEQVILTETTERSMTSTQPCCIFNSWEY